jgi:hypothetical protein
MNWTFGTFLWSTLVLFFWITCIWMFIAVFADVFRRDDLSGLGKAGWVALIVILPFLGILIYMIARPAVVADYRGSTRNQPVGPGRPSGRSAADEIARAAALHDEGKISASEFEQLKQQALSH